MKNMAYWKAKMNRSPLQLKNDDEKKTFTIGGQVMTVSDNRSEEEKKKEQEQIAEEERKKKEDQERIQREIDGTAEYTPDEQKEKLKKHFKDAKKNKNKK